jgi:mannose-6-phosphate isomerase-like protein (cupin superfamily)
MRINVFSLVVAAAVCSLPAVAQTRSAKPSSTRGLATLELLNQPDVRLLRVEIEAGVTRAMHAHNDVKFHLFIPVSGTVQLSIGSDNPVEVAPGQAQYIKKGTSHGFKNTGTTKATIIEVFVKEGAALADRDALGSLALGLAALRK